MTTNTHKTAVVIGRWQLPHLAHFHLIQRAFEFADDVVIVIGSSWRSRNPKNPFLFQEREAMLSATLTEDQRQRVRFVGVRDVYDDARWVSMVRAAVQQNSRPESHTCLVGFEKDASSYYLKRFPGWSYLDAGSPMALDSTGLREILFGGTSWRDAAQQLAQFIPPGVLDYLEHWVQTSAFAERCAEHQAVAAYKLKYPGPVYRTADAIVEADDHVLVVTRGNLIGRDTWAWPGGFANAGEEPLAASIRELIEETKIQCTIEQLQAAVVAKHQFSAPGRSPRGNIQTDAFHYKLDGLVPSDLLVVGSDDAKHAQWVHKSDLPAMMHNLFDDHDVIAEHFLGHMTPAVAGSAP